MKTHVMLDTGAGLSVIDMGTIDRMGLESQIIAEPNISPKCMDASGNRMEIIGIIKLKMELKGTNRIIAHNFQVLNVKTYHDIICGRDFMKHYDTIEFNFKANKIKVGKWWLKGITTKKEAVRLCSNIILEPRSEETVKVYCNKRNALILSELKPKNIPGVDGVYISRAHVIPDTEGEFLLTILNVNTHTTELKKKILIGNIVQPNGVIYTDESDTDILTNPKSVIDTCEIGDNLPEAEEGAMRNLLREFSDIFAKNAKKPQTTHVIEHRILTGDSQPAYAKPR